MQKCYLNTAFLRYCLFFMCVMLFFNKKIAAGTPLQSFSIVVPPTLSDTSIISLSLQDVLQLMQQACKCPVNLNDTTAQFQLILPMVSPEQQLIHSSFNKSEQYPYQHYPVHHYTWRGKADSLGIYKAYLKTSSYQGISFGLYGLLQQHLGFSFYHPKESIIPKLYQHINLKDSLLLEATPIFDKKGFHLHTQHPLELTEPLMDANYPNALPAIKQYLNWLVRNGQNYFEFCLLESIDRKSWGQHASAFVHYGHQRGLLIGVDVSLHMIQQKTFQLYRTPPRSFKNKKQQIIANLDFLFQADWDVFSVEFATAEFIGGNKAKKTALQLFLLEELQKRGARLTGRKHVVKEDVEVGLTGQEIELSSEQQAKDKARGMLSHTVMFYTMTEAHAPVYENENLRHMYKHLLAQQQERETWYYPESAYWVSFDNSIPLLLLPYLNARLADIDTCRKHGVVGHLTFSSGWEWGYWLIDWSIAQWSWSYRINGQEHRSPTQYVNAVFEYDKIHDYIAEHLDAQQRWLKDSNLVEYVVASNIIDEFPKPVSLQFQPRPKYSYRTMLRKIDKATVDSLENTALRQLHLFSEELNSIEGKYMQYIENYAEHIQKDKAPLVMELVNALRVANLRVQHKANTLGYLLHKRRANINQQNPSDSLYLLAIAARQQAQGIVNDMEKGYRYDVQTIARKRYGHTSYRFGYLYPVSNLYFWQREEAQIKNNKFSPLYKNIWNVARIGGFID